MKTGPGPGEHRALLSIFVVGNNRRESIQMLGGWGGGGGGVGGTPQSSPGMAGEAERSGFRPSSGSTEIVIGA